jgi:acyl-coenzyme A thioesterase PaaI-like protein
VNRWLADLARDGDGRAGATRSYHAPGMEPDLADLVARVRRDYPDCFACGPANPTGLHLEPADLDGDEAVARFTPRPDHGGAGETLHGGLAATVLDEIMVWSTILSQRVLTVTGTMELRYLHPVTVHRPIVVRGRVDQRSGRRLRCSGTLEVRDLSEIGEAESGPPPGSSPA